MADLKFENVHIPFTTLADGTRVITDLDIVREPYLLDFVMQFKHCFTRSNVMLAWVYMESDEQKSANLRRLQSLLQDRGSGGGEAGS